jgi:type IV pilus assembly protein PilM
MPNQTLLGIDISSEQINLAVLKQTRQGLKLLKACSTAVPAGVVKDGNIEDPAAVASLVKELRTRHKIRTTKAVVSLVARPVLIQIMEMPKQVPGNIGRYVQNEVKHCAILPNKNIVLDYCGISSAHSGCGRVFVAATENERVAEITRALTQSGLTVVGIEPPVTACARAIYAKKIAKKFDSNMLIAVVQDDGATVAVFRNQGLDFIRFKQLEQGIGQAREQLAQEINAILQFYEMELPNSTGKWQLVVVLDQSGQAAEQLGEFLRSKFSGMPVELCCPETICEDTPVVAVCEGGKTSFAAVGLAMKFLNTAQPKLQVNLLPVEAANIRGVKKDALIMANVAAAILIVIILAVGVLSHRLKNADEQIETNEQKQATEATQALLKEQQTIADQLNVLTGVIDRSQKVLQRNPALQWNKILDDIRQKTPTTLWITSLLCENSSRLLVQGRSVSYEAVHLFTDMLGKSGWMQSADLIGTEKDETLPGAFSFSIACTLAGN